MWSKSGLSFQSWSVSFLGNSQQEWNHFCAAGTVQVWLVIVMQLRIPHVRGINKCLRSEAVHFSSALLVPSRRRMQAGSSQTLHVLNFKSPCLCLPLPLPPPPPSGLQVDVSTPGARRVAFKPGRLCLAPPVGLLTDSLQLSKRVSAGPHRHGYRVQLLGLFPLLRALPGIPPARVRLKTAH